MATVAAILILLTLCMTSLCSVDDDLLHSACEEACQERETIRKQCFQTKCQIYMDQGKDWFPCFLSCWNHSQPCLSFCADSFWKHANVCSGECFGQTGKKNRHCRRTCAVRKFLDDRKSSVAPEIPRIKTKVDKPN